VNKKNINPFSLDTPPPTIRELVGNVTWTYWVTCWYMKSAYEEEACHNDSCMLVLHHIMHCLWGTGWIYISWTLNRDMRTCGMGAMVSGSQFTRFTPMVLHQAKFTQRSMSYISVNLSPKHVLALMSTCSEQSQRTCTDTSHHVSNMMDGILNRHCSFLRRVTFRTTCT